MSNNTKEIKESFIEDSTILKKYNISEEDADTLISEYQQSIHKVLLEYGNAQVSDGFRLEVVKLKKRNHVLRGQSYSNWRKYKIKAKVSYSLYETIAEAFDGLLED